MGQTAKAIVQARVRQLVGMMLEHGPIECERLCIVEWGVGHKQWLRYFSRARKRIEAADVGDAAITKAEIIARHLTNYSQSDIKDRTKILAELSKLTGSYAPEKTENVNTNTMPDATAAILGDPQVRQALLAAERQYEDDRKRG